MDAQDRRRGSLYYHRNGNPPFHLLVMTIVNTLIGVALWLQPHRFDNTPAYANLLDLVSPSVWGSIYLVVAAVMAVSIWRWHVRPLAVTAHVLAFALCGFWLAAFVIRYLTNDGTTIVNVLSWSVYLTLLVRSATLLDARDDRPAQ